MPFGYLPIYTTTSESTPPTPLPRSRESCILHLCSQRATFQKDKAYLKTVWGISQGFHLLLFNKANKEKYCFALLIFFFLLCVYVCVCLREQLAM